MPAAAGIAEAAERLAEWLVRTREAGRPAVVLTGAGASTESGLPDFRSAGGLWREVPEKLASVETLLDDPDAFYDFYDRRLKGLRGARPNRVHEVLARWETEGWIQAVLTQNVDGLHQAAGSRNVVELHGSLSRVRCHVCGRLYPPEALEERRCPACGGPLRPDIVLFGEFLPEEAWRSAEAWTEAAHLFLVVGSSLTVYPVAGLPERHARRGRPLVIVNRDPTPLDDRAALVVRETAGEVLAAADRILQSR
ncbi:NAD-dependent deacylase [Hydrogenibacillus schlegelii]|uniref:protein acetyllysine N-acetyltransferase n=1 Tax=Hydrogenibacillus schlegelii TaxID=1484 RepID=A0A132N6B2_HYDSH|nr:NAD-dependent deacylase [Hydrogenibacillus schlegelii]KWX05623.1 hypothetical protein TR75_07705 [Hydrogenibacillus schlegelii]MBT9282387.1 NAD-dependent deacylase [Hydrogenibacillus schlegelii]OAR05520.1 hypothetical protein SA87_11600 [Hydrogenibacillus schlegelii]PTQ54032.1 MAG: NAD-dependent protein deacetylase of SIR2 family [Hydrogenibacillus schlegelii]